MSISKYRLTENDVQKMVMSTAKHILENKQLLKGVVNEMKEGKPAINEDRFYGSPGFTPPSFFSGGYRDQDMPPMGGRPPYGPGVPFGPRPPYGYMPPMRPPMPYPPIMPPSEPGSDMRNLLRYMLFRNYINNHISALGDYYHGLGDTHEGPVTSGGGYISGGGGRRGGGYGGGNNSSRGGGSRKGGSSSKTPSSSTTPSDSTAPSGSTTPSGDTTPSGSTSPTGGTKIKEVPPTPNIPITPQPPHREPVESPLIGGGSRGGGGGNSNRSGGGDIGVRGNNNKIDYKQDSSDHSSNSRNVTNTNSNNDYSYNSHNTTNNINQSQHYDQRSSVMNFNRGGDRIIGNRRGGGGSRISHYTRYDHDHRPRRDFGGNGRGMRHNGHGGYGRRP